MTSVKYFHSAMTGAPVLSGTAGSLIAVLDACLVNGFGLQTASAVTVAGGVATATFPSGHPFEPDAIALFAGAMPAGLNGEKRILSATTNAVTFDAAGVADGAATGTITAKLAAAGWAKEFSGTNLAAYRATDVEGTRMFLRVDDTSATDARVVGYVSMTDINTGVDPFPNSTQASGGGWWPKASGGGVTARAWTVAVDGKDFKLHIHNYAADVGSLYHGTAGVIWGFGDFVPCKSGDGYACGLQCNSTNTTSSQNAMEYCSSSSPQAGIYVPRSYTGVSGSIAATSAPVEYFSGGHSGSTNHPTAPAYPNGPDNGLVLSKKMILEPSVCRRGYSRGLYVVPQNCHASFSWRQKIELAGRKLLAIKCGNQTGNGSVGVAFIDITGPWD